MLALLVPMLIPIHRCRCVKLATDGEDEQCRTETASHGLGLDWAEIYFYVYTGSAVLSSCSLLKDRLCAVFGFKPKLIILM